MKSKILVIQVAALAHQLVKNQGITQLCGMPLHPMQTVFPAVTCTVQAGFRTGTPTNQHGMTANGIFHRPLRKALFWEQSAHLIQGPRIWNQFRQAGNKVALLFWQQSLDEDADIILSPAPIHKHHGGMILDCYSKPAHLYPDLCSALKHPFALRHYWGPLASAKSGDWIAQATCHVITDPDLAPDLCLTYLPTLDYDLQRHGPDSPHAARALHALVKQLALLIETARRTGYEILLFGDYPIHPTHTPIHPNRLLAAHGYLNTRTVKGMHYPDLYSAQAFALVDHEIAHIYLQSPALIHDVKKLFANFPGIETIIDPSIQDTHSIAHANAGELILVASPGHWFAYPWWENKSHAPDYAGHIDIHNKPGYDPCELFFGWPPGRISQNTVRVRGSHGRNDNPVACASTFLSKPPQTLDELAQQLRHHLEG
jgi:predicted AlkP superfamily pyrophosphatase or phosphodiesterase